MWKKTELIMRHVRSKKYFIFPFVKKLCNRTWNPLPHYYCSVWKPLTQGSKKLEKVVRSFIWIRLLSDQTMSVVSHSFHVNNNNLYFSWILLKLLYYYSTGHIRNVTTDGFKSTGSSEPLKPGAGDTIPFLSFWRDRETMLTPPTT